MKIVGLTGGIGSGKSTVARAFADIGIPVYIADDASKQILNSHPDAVERVIQLLGEEAYHHNADGSRVANRALIAQKVFTNKEQLTQLNNILHPLVHDHFKQWQAAQDAVYCIYEAAILFESGGYKNCDTTLLIYAPEDIRIKRVVIRDGVEESAVRQRLKNQWTDKQRLEKSDFVMINEDLQSIRLFVNNFHEFMLKSNI